MKSIDYGGIHYDIPRSEIEKGVEEFRERISLPPESKSGLKRIRLSDTRPAGTRKIELRGWDLYVTVGFYENGQPGEVFAKVGKAGSTVNGLTEAIAVQCSMLLQVGVPASKMVGKMRHVRFEPDSDDFKSIVDAIAAAVMSLTSERGGMPDLDYEGRKVDW